MPFPKTEEELIQAGYEPPERPSRCNGPNCGAEIEWWITPKGKRIPLDPGTYEPHWGTCPDKDSFRRKK